MSLSEIKEAIPKLTPREQAELDLWLQDRENDAVRRTHFLELKRKLEESCDAVARGRFREWTDHTMEEIIAEARRERATRDA